MVGWLFRVREVRDVAGRVSSEVGGRTRSGQGGQGAGAGLEGSVFVAVSKNSGRRCVRDRISEPGTKIIEK